MTGIVPVIPPHVFQEAVRGFWDTRIAQAQAQTLAGKVDQGNRSAVTVMLCTATAQHWQSHLVKPYDRSLSTGKEQTFYLTNR
jgi:hypothetical protein